MYLIWRLCGRASNVNDWPWRERANLSPFAVALKAGDITWCWRDLQHRIDTLAAGFIAQGVGESAGVVLRSKNTLDAVLSYLALLQTGARLLLNPQLPWALCDELLSQLDIAFVLDLAEPELPLNIPALTMQNACWLSSAGWQPQRIATLTLTSGLAVYQKPRYTVCAISPVRRWSAELITNVTIMVTFSAHLALRFSYIAKVKVPEYLDSSTCA